MTPELHALGTALSGSLWIALPILLGPLLGALFDLVFPPKDTSMTPAERDAYIAERMRQLGH